MLPGEQGKGRHKGVNLGTDGRDGVGVVGVGKDAVDKVDDGRHLGRSEAARSNSGSTEAKPGSSERTTGIERNHILISSNISGDEGLFSGLTGEIGEFSTEVDEHQVIVGTAGDQLITLSNESSRHSGSVSNDLFLVIFILRPESLAESNSLSSDHVFQRAALDTGKNSGIKDSGHLFDLTLRSSETPGIVEVGAHKDDTAARTAKGFMGGGSNDMGVRNRVGEDTGSDQTGRVSHIDQEQSPNFVGDGTHTGVIPFARVSRSTPDEELRTVFESEALHLVVINSTGGFGNFITHSLIVHTGKIDRRTVRKVPAVRKVEAEESVAGFQASNEDSHISLSTGVRLDVSV